MKTERMGEMRIVSLKLFYKQIFRSVIALFKFVLQLNTHEYSYIKLEACKYHI